MRRNKMRRILIDTDTASDDAVAILMALREPEVHVEAITVVAGNSPLKVCIKNALVTVEKAGTSPPPVYAGASEPLFREQYLAEYVHGEDGMGNMNLPDPKLQLSQGHGVDKIIELVHRFPGELDIVALGPLTNIALALWRSPDIAGKIKQLYIMGGAGMGPGNVSPVAEFNFFADPEAAHKVISSDISKTIIGWDVSTDETFLGEKEMALLPTLGPLGEFALRCNASLIEFNKGWNKEGFDLPDPTAMAVALYPDIVTKEISAYGFVEYKSDTCYGQYLIDIYNLKGKEPNTRNILSINPELFKSRLFQLLKS